MPGESTEFPPFLDELVEPWYSSLKSPGDSQASVMRGLLEGYGHTTYGKEHGAAEVDDVQAFRRSFPVVKYGALKPYLDEVMNGNYESLLSQPVARWVMTRGSTGSPKMIPCTDTHLSQILTVGARAIVNFARRRSNASILDKRVLNLNFPSEVGVLSGASKNQSYGFSSGTYARLNPELGSTGLVPRQEKIDSLGGGISRADWERRFELVYQEARDEQVGSTMGVTPVIEAFACYIKRRHGVLPRQLWKIEALFCTSVAKIHSHYSPILKREYGDAPVVEMYTATEGVFAQQLDDLPYVCPNYDVYLFEVQSGNRVRYLHEMKPNEWGKIIISTPLFPRYDIGDMVESLGKGYFRVFGRSRLSTIAEHVLFNALAFRG